MDGWIRENQGFAAKGAGIPDAELNQRIRKRFDSVRHGYEDFIRRHPDNAKARIAFASFLHDMGEEDAEVEQLEKGRDLDTNNPTAWNQLANFQGHNGATTNAFISYEKAIELDPREAVYYWNFATTVYLFRKDAMAHYHITEQQVFDKALNLYVKALQFDPTNFVLAADLAQTYYGIRPVRTDEALNAYTNALSLARDEIEREGIYIHLTRFKYNAGRFAQARAHLDAVTNAMYADLKKLLTRNLDENEQSAKETNRPPAAITNAPVNAGVSQPQSATNKQAPVVENPK